VRALLVSRPHPTPSSFPDTIKQASAFTVPTPIGCMFLKNEFGLSEAERGGRIIQT